MRGGEKDGVGGCERWLEAAVGDEENLQDAGDAESVVRHEKMVIPSRMCPMHMHVFPQNGWPGCGVWKWRGRERGQESGDGSGRTK